MKNKLKALLALFVGVFAFSVVGLSTKAADLSYNVDNDTKTSYAANGQIYANDIATVYANRSLTVTANKSTSTAANDSTQTFAKGLLPGGNCNSYKNSSLKVTSSKDGATIGVYYTFSDAGFSSKDQSKAASLVIYSSSTTLKTFDQDAGSNKVAYYNEYSISGVGTTICVGSSGSRLVIMGFIIKEGTAAVTHTVTIKNALNITQTIGTLVVEDGDVVDFSSSIWGYDFDALYVDEKCQTKYAEAITSDTTLYANYVAWPSDTINNPYELSNSLISKLSNLSNLGNEIELTGTIYTLLPSTTYTTTNNKPCVSTGGTASTTQKAIKIVVPAKGYISTLITTGDTSGRNAQLLDSTDVEVSTTSGNAIWTTEEAKLYEQRTLVYEVEAGTYYLGGSDAMRILSISFTQINLQYQLNEEYTSGDTTYKAGSQIRYVATINCLTAETLADAKITLNLTLGEKAATEEIATVYKSVDITGIKQDAVDGTYYAVFIISGLDQIKTTTDLSAQLTITVGGITYTSVTRTYTITQ